MASPTGAPPPHPRVSVEPSVASTDDDGDSFIQDAVPHALEQLLGPNFGTAPAIPGHGQAPHPDLRPSGPICSFGHRLAFTYFPAPAPTPALLNSLTPGRAAPAPVMETSNGGPPAAAGGEAQDEMGVHWFTIDDQLQYLSFFQDYGPLNVGCLYRFCLHLHSLLTAPEHAHQKVFLYSSDEPDKKVNAALLMALYAMVVMRWSVADVLHPLSCLELQPYRDAGYSRADYHLHPQSIIYGLSRALAHNLLDLSTFDLPAYEAAEKVETGDWNWLTPGFVAFASPVEAGYTAAGGASRGGKISRSFRNVLEEFENKGVKVVVRLNKKLYSPSHFTDRGIDHVEMYFDDGTNPTMEIVREFIDLSVRVISGGGAVAVHCKAGLGRTGTLIGAYLIYKHGFTADEAIGFMRLMRPGSCVGPQQHFLYENQMEWVRWAAQDQLRAELASSGQLASSSTSASASLSASTNATASTSTSTDPLASARPITPPNEAALAEARSRATTPAQAYVPPVTPKRGGGHAVPGQPRKTPGRSRHGVAPPEEVSPGEQAAQDAEAAEERMEGVVLSSPRKSRTSTGSAGAGASAKGKTAMLTGEEAEEGDVEEDELAMQPVAASPQKLGLAPPAPIPSASTSRPKTPTATSSRPTRIARPARPLSALADNRIVDRLGAGAAQGLTRSTRSGGGVGAGSGAGLARSKAAKNLTTVFEGDAGRGAGAGGAGGDGAQSRYPLRNGRTTSAGSTSSSTGAPAEPPASPTKLPQRVLGKRGATANGAGAGAGRGFNPAAAAAAAAAANGQGASVAGKAGAIGPMTRNVRRRRSSMGSAEFTSAG
ncbi:hypothetical protein JCM10207_006401 [Rhodosporidiobolus poonsookiae]